MASPETYPLNDRFEKVTENMRHDCLGNEDECYFLGEYVSRKKVEQCETRRWVRLLKRNNSEAVRVVANHFKKAVVAHNLIGRTFVPVPSSVPPPENQLDRIEILLKAAGLPFQKYVRQTKSIVPNRFREKREMAKMTPEELEDAYEFDERLEKTRMDIAIVDDVLTEGMHFTVIKKKIRKHFPDASIIGLFIARTKQWNEINDGVGHDND